MKMRILELCNIYFLGLVLIQGIIMITSDYTNFKYYKMMEVAKKSRKMGIVAIAVALSLYVVQIIIV